MSAPATAANGRAAHPRAAASRERFWTEDRLAEFRRVFLAEGFAAARALHPDKTDKGLKQVVNTLLGLRMSDGGGADAPAANVGRPQGRASRTPRTAAQRAADEVRALEERVAKARERAARAQAEERERAEERRRRPLARIERRIAEMLAEGRAIDPSFGRATEVLLESAAGAAAAGGVPPKPAGVSPGDLAHVRKRAENLLPLAVATLARELRLDRRTVAAALAHATAAMFASPAGQAFLDKREP